MVYFIFGLFWGVFLIKIAKIHVSLPWLLKALRNKWGVCGSGAKAGGC